MPVVIWNMADDQFWHCSGLSKQWGNDFYTNVYTITIGYGSVKWVIEKQGSE